MVTNVPNQNDFNEAGISYLNLAWSTIIDMIVDLDESDRWRDGIEDDVKTEYWIACEREIATALSLAH